jgi:SAM-dependent methyltransferase
MEWYELYDIEEREMELINPCSPEKILEVGRMLGLEPGTRVIEFGSGHAEVLSLWAERYGIAGVGVEFRPRAHQRAQAKLRQRGLADRVTVHHGDGAAFPFEEGSFDVACCIGASFIWGGFAATVPALRKAIKPTGRLAIGEPYWRHGHEPPSGAPEEYTILTEPEILALCRGEGLEMAGIVRGNEEDWDTYSSTAWQGLLAWLEENPGHPEWDRVSAWLHKSQDSYLTRERPYVGWAIYVLRPAPAR